jgi:hypothetical protein
MGAIKGIDMAMLAISHHVGVESVVSCSKVPNLLTVYYSPFPHPINVLVGIDGLYTLHNDIDTLVLCGCSVVVVLAELKALNISILEQ